MVAVLSLAASRLLARSVAGRKKAKEVYKTRFCLLHTVAICFMSFVQFTLGGNFSKQDWHSKYVHETTRNLPCGGICIRIRVEMLLQNDCWPSASPHQRCLALLTTSITVAVAIAAGAFSDFFFARSSIANIAIKITAVITVAAVNAVIASVVAAVAAATTVAAAADKRQCAGQDPSCKLHLRIS